MIKTLTAPDRGYLEDEEESSSESLISPSFLLELRKDGITKLARALNQRQALTGGAHANNGTV